MTTILLDPTLRRARIMRVTVAVFVIATVAVATRSALDLRATTRAAPTLPSPRRGSKSIGRRPVFGRDPVAGQRRRQAQPLIDATAASPPSISATTSTVATSSVPPPTASPTVARVTPTAARVTSAGPPAASRITPTAPLAAARVTPAAPLAAPGVAATTPLAAPHVTAFIEPSVVGAVGSLRAHAAQIADAAITGLLLERDGGVIDRVDRSVLRVAADVRVPAFVLLQNLDARDGRWRPELVRGLATNAGARSRLAIALVHLCTSLRLAGIHLDLEALDDDWSPLVPIVHDAARALHARGFTLAVDVPATMPDDVLRAVASSADRVVVMAYDEHDADAPPGPIASDAFVADALAAATRVVPADRLGAGLAIYGYDWIGDDSADPISFVDAHAAAREARVDPRWDPSGNARFAYVDDEGTHQVWLTDAASAWNQARIAANAGIRSVALWRLGGEDPGVWEALAHLGDASPPISVVAPDARVTNEGDGPFLALALSPAAGHRMLDVAGGRIRDERWSPAPTPYLVRRAGIVPGAVALTFDDGPDPQFTPQILDILAREHVPATFFVIGSQAAVAPALVRRIDAEGHELGNHTFTHPAVDEVGALRLRTELESTTQLIASLIGRRPVLYRPPSLADVEPRTAASAAAFARAGSLGYLAVDADVDPRDWERHGTLEETTQQLVRDTVEAAARGGVVLLHDGGGDRTATVRALPQIIAALRGRGLRFVTLSSLVGKTRDEVMPRVAATPIAGRVLRVAVGLASVLRAIVVVTLGLVALRAIALLVAATVSELRRRRRPMRGPLPSVTAVIPAFNEAAVIERTIESVLASDVPVDLVVVDDGSTDGTAELVARRYRRERRVRLLRQPNGGKAAALRAGIAACRSEVVVALDGDTLFAPTTIRHLIEPMSDPRVAAVAGSAEVGNVENALARWQSVEYLTQQELERRAWDAVDAVPIVPGAVGAWRRRALLDAGGFSSDTLAEDADLAMALCRRGWRVVHAASARARTEVPITHRALVRQRVRWSFGVLQALWKHRAALVEPRAGAFGRLVWPAMVVYQVLLPLMTPAAILSLALAVVGGHLRPAVSAAAVLAGVDALQLAGAFVLARLGGGRPSWRLLASAWTARLYYRALLLLISLRSIARLADGVPLGWGKLARRNTAVAYSAATAAARPLPVTRGDRAAS